MMHSLYTLFRQDYTNGTHKLYADFSRYGFNQYMHYSKSLDINIELSFGYWVEMISGRHPNRYDRRLQIQTMYVLYANVIVRQPLMRDSQNSGKSSSDLCTP